MLSDHIRWHLAPAQHMVRAFQDYLDHGYQPGGFGTALLSNDLRGAAGAADSINQGLLFEWAQFLWNEFPAAAWGSPENVRDWMAARRRPPDEAAA